MCIVSGPVAGQPGSRSHSGLGLSPDFYYDSTSGMSPIEKIGIWIHLKQFKGLLKFNDVSKTYIIAVFFI